MNKKILVVSLFVHDMKAPLSVIGSGASKLREVVVSSDYDAVGKKLVNQITQTKNSASTLLNQILDMDSSVETSCDIPESQSVSKPGVPIFSSIVSRVKDFSIAKGKSKKKPNLCQAIQELKSFLAILMQLIDAFEIQAGYTDAGHQKSAVLKRMKRNAKTAIHFADNAIAILISHESTNLIDLCQVSDIIQTAMTEVLDLVDPDISDAMFSKMTLQEFKKTIGLKQIYLNVNEDLWTVDLFCDQTKIRQVIVNLLLNALKFRKETIHLEIDIKDRQLVFNIMDDGKGISKEDQPYIFKNRFQVKSAKAFPIRGHGIGLAGAQALLESINGHLKLDSSADGKTCFSAVVENVFDRS